MFQIQMILKKFKKVRDVALLYKGGHHLVLTSTIFKQDQQLLVFKQKMKKMMKMMKMMKKKKMKMKMSCSQHSTKA